jgi:hypothetical protein
MQKILSLPTVNFILHFPYLVMATKTKTTTSTRRPQRGLTFDDVWAALMKTSDDLDKLKLQTQETDRIVRATALQMQETDKKIGRLGNRLGDIIEWLMTPNLHRKFCELGYTFTTTSRNKKFHDEQRHILAEVDAFLENGIYVLAVEVKTNVCATDIKEHVERMDTIRRYADAHEDTRKFLGAVAAPKIEDSVRRTAYRAGFFVIEPSEEAVEVFIPEGFKPKEW